MTPTAQYPFLASLLSPFEKRHRRTLALVIAAIAATGQARSFAIATTLAQWLGTRLDSAINRFYRLLRNDRVDYVAFITNWARLLCRDPARPLLIARYYVLTTASVAAGLVDWLRHGTPAHWAPPDGTR